MRLLLASAGSASPKIGKGVSFSGKRLSGRFVNSDSDYIRERNKGNALALVVLEAVAAVDGTVVSGLERDLGGRPALRADRVKHLTVVAACGFAACAAVLAANGFVLESLLRVKLLLAGRKDEFLTAILAYQCFVLEHLDFSPFRFVKFFDTRVPADLVFAPTPANWKCRYPAMCLSLLPLSKCMFDMLRLDLLLDRTMLTGLCPLTWIVLPATGIDFQPQT